MTVARLKEKTERTVAVPEDVGPYLYYIINYCAFEYFDECHSETFTFLLIFLTG